MAIICRFCRKWFEYPEMVEWLPLPSVGDYRAICRNCIDIYEGKI